MWELQGTCSERNSNDCWASTSSASRISASFFRSFMWLLISANCSAGGAVMHWRGEQVSDRGGAAGQNARPVSGVAWTSLRDAAGYRTRSRGVARNRQKAKSFLRDVSRKVALVGQISSAAGAAPTASDRWRRLLSRSSTRSRRGSSRRRARAAPPPNSWSSGDRSAWRSRSSRAAPTRARPTSTSWAARALTWPPHTSQRAPPRRRYATLSVRRRCS